MNPQNSTGAAQRDDRRYHHFNEGVKKTGIRDVRQYTQRQFTPEQMGLFQQGIDQVGEGSYLQKLAGGDEQTFNEIEAPSLRQFSGLQAGIANKYSGLGLGARRSSGFQQEQGQFASNFAQQLQSQRQGLRQTALRDLMESTNMLLGQRPYERSLVQKPQKQLSGWEQAGIAAAGGAAEGATKAALA